MSASTVSSIAVFLWVCLFVPLVSGATVVEGFDGGSVVLPCNLTANGDLTWKQGTYLILVKPASDGVIIPEGLYKGDVSLVNSADLRINTVWRDRDGDDGDGDKVFECGYTGGGKQQIQLRLLASITGVSIPEAVDGRITVTVGTIKVLTCSVTGDPNPPPSYSWRVDDMIINGQTSGSYNLTPNKSKKTVQCTATKRYSNGDVFSEKEVTATLNVQYLDTPSVPTPSSSTTVVGNNTVTLRCLVEGNPLPSYQWIYNKAVLSQSADYTIENVQRSAAGEYTCRVINTVTRHDRATNLIVQYPPDVTVKYDKPTQTLTCTAEGVPRNYSFSQWEHHLDGKLLQSLGTQSSGSTATLKLPDTLTYEDTGYYVCQVFNGIRSPQRAQVLLTPQTPAIFEDQASSVAIEGQRGTISVPFYTYSDTPNVKVVWEKSRESTVLTTHREATGLVRLMIHGKSVSIEGVVTVLTLRNLTSTDKVNYVVTVTNDIYGVALSNQIVITVYVKPSSSTESATPVNRNPDDTDVSGNFGAAVGGGITAVVVVIIIVIAAIVLFRKNRKKSQKTVRNPHELTVAQFQNSRQEGGVYQDLERNPDYENATDNQPYTALATIGRGDGDYEECDVTVNQTNHIDGLVAPSVAQYEDVSFSSDGETLQHKGINRGVPETTDYVNKAFKEEASKTYYNI